MKELMEKEGEYIETNYADDEESTKNES